jgi:hypothetical protein
MWLQGTWAHRDTRAAAASSGAAVREPRWDAGSDPASESELSVLRCAASSPCTPPKASTKTVRCRGVAWPTKCSVPCSRSVFCTTRSHAGIYMMLPWPQALCSSATGAVKSTCSGQGSARHRLGTVRKWSCGSDMHRHALAERQRHACSVPNGGAMHAACRTAAPCSLSSVMDASSDAIKYVKRSETLGASRAAALCGSAQGAHQRCDRSLDRLEAALCGTFPASCRSCLLWRMPATIRSPSCHTMVHSHANRSQCMVQDTWASTSVHSTTSALVNERP